MAYNKMAREVGVFDNVSEMYEGLKQHREWKVFVLVNIAVYALAMVLIVLRLFGLI